jgi:hypothetical protein
MNKDDESNESSKSDIPRALLTDSERRHIKGETKKQRRYEAVSRVRTRINSELTTDVEILREHHPELFDELREVVCKKTLEEIWDPQRQNWGG